MSVIGTIGRCGRGTYEWEESLQRHGVAGVGDDLGLLDDGQILLVDVDEADGVEVGAVVGEAELELLVLALNVGGVDGQGAEDGQVDDVGVGAAALDHHSLVEDGECPGSLGAGEERQFRGDDVAQVAVEAVLLAFLADHGADERNVLLVTVGSETSKGVLESAEDDIGEGLGEGDGALEVRGWENVFARLDGSLAGGGQDGVGADSVQLFLREDGVQGVENDALGGWAWNFEAGDVVGDVADQAGEEGNLEELVEGDEFEDGDVAGLKGR